MKVSKSFIGFTATCCALSVITTLGIHLFFPEFSSDFNERLLLYKNTVYLLNRWWVILHCLLVMISMWGIYLLRQQQSPGFTGLGLISFVVFSVAEIARQILVLFYLNGLRVKYLNTTNSAVLEILKVDIENFSLLSNSLFGLFILAFALGNLFYGLSLWGEPGYGKVLSWLFLIWSAGNFLSLSLEFFPSDPAGRFIEIYSYTYQPLMRGVIAFFLFRSSKSLPAWRET